MYLAVACGFRRYVEHDELYERAADSELRMSEARRKLLLTCYKETQKGTSNT